MDLTHARKRELRDLGWSVLRRKAKRPPAIEAEVVLHVGEDVVIEESGGTYRPLPLDGVR